ncbi:MAG: hypothetical protein J5497_03055, partial [Selenomonadaceae bacterium]|nr:hypothetical protein [Selenomonadaceae bacterium]
LAKVRFQPDPPPSQNLFLFWIFIFPEKTREPRSCPQPRGNEQDRFEFIYLLPKCKKNLKIFIELKKTVILP